MALAAAAGVDLRLHDVDRATEAFDNRLGLVGRVGNAARQHGDPELLQKLLGLVLMNVHASSPAGVLSLTRIPGGTRTCFGGRPQADEAARSATGV